MPYGVVSEGASVHTPASAALLVQLFLGEREYALRPQSSQFYRYVLGRYVDHLGGVMPTTTGPLHTWLGSLRGRVAPATLKNHWAAARVFHRWAEATHGCYNPCEAVQPPRQPKTIPVRLSGDDVVRVWRACETDRERLLWLLLVGTGMRIGEVVALRRSRISERVITIPDGKVGSREVPVPHPEFHALLAWVGHGDVLFPAGRSRHPMGRAGLQALWRRMCGRVGIFGRKAGPHAARHGFGLTLLRRSGDRGVVMWAMGHKRIETSLIYAELEPDDVLDIWPDVSPIAGMLDAGDVADSAPADADRYPREAILHALDALGGQGTPVTVARHLGRKRATTNRLMWAMARDGELARLGYGRYGLRRAA